MSSSRRLRALTRALEDHLVKAPQGYLLGDTFLIDLEQPLGAGGQGAVFRGIHINLELPVAVKVFGADEIDSEKMVARFVREARILAQLNSRDVVRVWDLDRVEAAGCYYFVTEFVRGAPLDEAAKSVGRPLSEEEGLTACIAAAQGLANMHDAGILHRDFKPGNALWLAGTSRIKVCDLGLAKESGEDTMGLTVMGETFGSPAYMAPEQARGARDVCPGADVYSLGAILHYLLIGEAPASITTLQELLQGGKDFIKEMHEKLAERKVGELTTGLLVSMLSRAPEERPADARAAIKDMEEVLGKLGRPPVDLSRTFAAAKIKEPLAVQLTSEPGTLWQPPISMHGSAGRFLPDPGDTVRLQPGGETQKSGDDEPGFETQFWEEAFPVLKEERKKKQSGGETG